MAQWRKGMQWDSPPWVQLIIEIKSAASSRSELEGEVSFAAHTVPDEIQRDLDRNLVGCH